MLLSNLPDAVLSKCMTFVGEGNYIFVAGVCRSFRDTYKSYLQQYHEQKPFSTNLNEIVSSIPRLQLVMHELNIDINIICDRTKIEWRGTTMSFGTAAIACAAYNGNLDVLIWVKNNDRQTWQWYYTDCYYLFPCNEVFPCNEAAKGDQLKVLQWLRSKDGGECHWDEYTCRIVAEYGHFNMLKWAHQNGCPWNGGTTSEAARGGRFEILKWVHQNGCPWDEGTCGAAAEYGHFDILKWLHHNGCPWDEETCGSAGMNGHFEILKWARQNGCPWDKLTCTLAAREGHFEILKWSHQKGCPWDEYTCSAAVTYGHFDILKWLHHETSYFMYVCKRIGHILRIYIFSRVISHLYSDL